MSGRLYRAEGLSPSLAMKTLLVWALLALVPFSGVRMLCLDRAGIGARVRPSAAAVRPEDAAACRKTCALHAHPAPKPACVLVADAACAFLMGIAPAVVPVSPGLSIARMAARVELIPSDSYRSLVLSPPGPPPRPGLASS